LDAGKRLAYYAGCSAARRTVMALQAKQQGDEAEESLADSKWI